MKKSCWSRSMLRLMLIPALAAGLLSSCGAPADDSSAASPSPPSSSAPTLQASPSPEAQTISFTDSAGRKVDIPKQVDKIAPSGQLAQIVLFSLAPDKLVGLSNKWSQDAEAFLNSKYLQLPVFGQFYGSADLNKEALAAAKPQLIIDIGEKKSSIVEDMDSVQQQLGIPTIFIEAELATMPAAYETLGQVLGLEAEAQTLADYCRDVYTNTTEQLKQVEGKKVKVLYSLGENGTNVIGQGSFHAEILDLMGDNVAVIDNPSSKGTGNEVSMEQIIQWKPEVILFAPQSIYAQAASDPLWQQMEAVQQDRYYQVPGIPYNWLGQPPSINRYMGMVWLSQLLYPDLFDYDLRQEVNRFYKLFYHSEDLTDEQYQELTRFAVK